jgi:hypothetical protein
MQLRYGQALGITFRLRLDVTNETETALNSNSSVWLFAQLTHGSPVGQQFQVIFGWSSVELNIMKLLVCCKCLNMKSAHVCCTCLNMKSAQHVQI